MRLQKQHYQPHSDLTYLQKKKPARIDTAPQHLEFGKNHNVQKQKRGLQLSHSALQIYVSVDAAIYYFAQHHRTSRALPACGFAEKKIEKNRKNKLPPLPGGDNGGQQQAFSPF